MNPLSLEGFQHILWPIWPTRLGEDPNKWRPHFLVQRTWGFVFPRLCMGTDQGN